MRKLYRRLRIFEETSQTEVTAPQLVGRDSTGWPGWEDSNSDIRPRAMYLRFRDNSCCWGLQLATGDHSRLSCGVGDTQLAGDARNVGCIAETAHGNKRRV
jgi:hypothetical protein